MYHNRYMQYLYCYLSRVISRGWNAIKKCESGHISLTGDSFLQKRGTLLFGRVSSIISTCCRGLAFLL